MSAAPAGLRRTVAAAFAAAAFLAVSVAIPAVPAGAGGPAGQACPPAWQIRVSAKTPRQGEPVLVEFLGGPGADNAAIGWKEQRFPMRAAGGGRFVGIIGVDLMEAPGKVPVAVFASDNGAPCRVDDVLEVRQRTFPLQKLSLPRRMAEFDAPTLARIREEAARLNATLSAVAGAPAWDFPLVPPVADFRPSGFGARRVINGEARSPHAGVDVTLPEGTPVVSIADGVVAFAGEQFFGGNSVVIDHGGGLFSIYYHLEGFSVAAGQRVSRGERIGAVGASGRAVGPHLHFSVRAAGGRVDPELLFGLAAH
ncbi:MAG: M23 family metallopeptidase [Gemmatimonadota bacterium]